MTDHMVNRVSEECISPGHPLAGLFTNLPSDIPFSDAMNDILTGCTPDQISDEYKGLLQNSIDLTMECANEVMNSNPAVTTAYLNISEVAAIKMYSMGAEPSDAGLSHLLNKALREEIRDKLKPFVKILWLLMHAMRKAQPYPRPMVYRGVKLDLSDQYREGQIVTWKGFTSTTTTMGVLNQPLFLVQLREIEPLDPILNYGNGNWNAQLREIEPLDPILNYGNGNWNTQVVQSEDLSSPAPVIT
eukprot:gene42172-biopygen8456